MPDAKLMLGDCRDFLDSIDGEVDAVLMDPPYGIEHTSNRSSTWQGMQIANDGDTALRDLMIAWATARDLPWAAFGTWKRHTPESARGVLVWDKGPAFGMGDLSFPWKPSWEEIAVGGPGWAGKRDEGVLRGHIQVSWESKGRRHPHQKPVTLLAQLIAKLPGRRKILDPFMGTGTTGIACVQAGIDFVGCEIDPGYFAVAERRIAEAQADLPLFAPSSPHRAETPMLFAD